MARPPISCTIDAVWLSLDGRQFARFTELENAVLTVMRLLPNDVPKGFRGILRSDVKRAIARGWITNPRGEEFFVHPISSPPPKRQRRPRMRRSAYRYCV